MKGVIWGQERSKTPRRGRWSQAEIGRLRELYGLRDDVTIAKDGFLTAQKKGLVIDRDITLNVKLLGGDFNGDGVIDAIDLALLGKNIGNTESPFPKMESPRPPTAISGTGTATIDGVLSAGEWGGAGTVSRSVGLSGDRPVTGAVDSGQRFLQFELRPLPGVVRAGTSAGVAD